MTMILDILMILFHINWKKLLPAIIIIAVAVIALIIVLVVSFLVIEGKKYLQMHLQPRRLHLSAKQIPTAIIL